MSNACRLTLFVLYYSSLATTPPMTTTLRVGLMGILGALLGNEQERLRAEAAAALEQGSLSRRCGDLLGTGHPSPHDLRCVDRRQVPGTIRRLDVHQGIWGGSVASIAQDA